MAVFVRPNKDPAAALTHFVGFLAALAALVVLLAVSAHDGAKLAALGIYGVTLVGLFLASSVYHFFDAGERGNQWLRRLDHSAIFLLIGGTYVPPLLHLLDGTWRIAMLSVVAGLALAGVIFRLVWLSCPRVLYVSAYIAMGWVGVIPAPIMVPLMTPLQLALLAGGGLAYTGGAVIYARKRPDPWPGVFGFHEVWHLFVLLGAFLHFGFVLTLVDTPYPPF